MSEKDFIKCDQCEKQFIINMEVEKLPNSRFMDYFVCAHCGTRYNVSIVTEKGIRLRRRLRSYYENGKQEIGPYKRLLGKFQAEMSKPETQVIPKWRKRNASGTASMN